MPKISPFEIKPLTGTKTPGAAAVPLSDTDLWVFSVTILPADDAGAIYIGDSNAQHQAAPLSFPALPGCCYNLKDIYVKGGDADDTLKWTAVVPK